MTVMTQLMKSVASTLSGEDNQQTWTATKVKNQKQN